jgi:16S rRNA (cytosine1402-N4)-methyltransferase
VPDFSHAPVLLREVVELAAPAPGRHILDCTLGLGGHAERLLAGGAEVTGVDRDPAARARAAERLAGHGARFTPMPGTFADAVEDLASRGARFHAVLADLGVSSMQLDDSARGFSIRSTERAAMTMSGERPDAIDFIADAGEEGVVDVLKRYGEEHRPRAVARALCRAVAEGRTSGAELAEAVRRAIPGRHPRHPALRAFQALRIAVNDELGQLERLLDRVAGILLPGGTAIIISFHSLEDRLVKHRFRDQVAAGRLAASARKPVLPAEDELAGNPRSASAKLRWGRAP